MLLVRRTRSQTKIHLTTLANFVENFLLPLWKRRNPDLRAGSFKQYLKINCTSKRQFQALIMSLWNLCLGLWSKMSVMGADSMNIPWPFFNLFWFLSSVAFITAVWRTPSKDPKTQYLTFEATRHHLQVRSYDPVTKTQTAYYDEDDYDDTMAEQAEKFKFLYLPLGRSHLKMANLKALNDFIEKDSEFSSVKIFIAV